MVINSNTPDTLYAGTEFQGVFKSTDGGESWTAINDGLTNLSINALAIDPINPTTIYAGIDGVYRYEDLGTNASDLLDSLDSLDSSDSSDSFDFFCLISTSAGGFREVKNELAIFLLLISGLIVFAIIRWIYRDQEP
jgi:hypothetical protein